MLTALVAALVGAQPASSQLTLNCTSGTQKTIEVGIVKAIGCWTETTKDGATVEVASAAANPQGVDLNGFVVTLPTNGSLQINTKTREVATMAQGPGSIADEAYLNSRNWPEPGKITQMGLAPLKLDFIAPLSGTLHLTDIRFGSFAGGILAGLSPVGDVETPIELEEGGKGSMNLVVQLTGYFSLKGRPQTVTVELPTESGAGTHVDGFELKLKEIDAFKFVTINDFEAKYSQAHNVIAGGATLTFPFSPPGKQGIGFGGNFQLTNGNLTKVSADARGLQIPIGAPPGGFITEVGGGFELQNSGGDNFTALLSANAKGVFGPVVASPFGNIAPIEVDAGLEAGHKNNELFFLIRGGVKVFRLEVGNIYLAIHFNSGIEFGVDLGIGFPSYRNNENDPFYIGANVGGWIAKAKFQFEGSGRVALFGLKIFDGRILVNDTATGACWTVIGLPGGAVYRYGWDHVETFGVGCRLDDYKEQYPAGAAATAARGRSFTLGPRRQVLKVKGVGKAPRFELKRAGGPTLRVPTDSDTLVVEKGFKHAFFVNETTDTTDVLLPQSKGRWTLTPYEGAATVTSVKAGRQIRREKVKAKVVGTGRVRTLVWNTTGRPHTRLVFTEKLRGGLQIPILHTGKANGRKRFRVVGRSHYGKRRLRVSVIHGNKPDETVLADTFVVKPPNRLPAPREVSAWRHVHSAGVKWSKVRGAHGYLVEVGLRKQKGGKRRANFVRRVTGGRRHLLLPVFPGGGVASARVYALNSDDKLGRPGRVRFKTHPKAHNLRQSARQSAKSAVLRGGAVALRMNCPAGGHCRNEVLLKSGTATIGRTRFQQTPETFHNLRVRLKAPLLGGQDLSVVVKQRRTGEQGRARARVG